MTNHDPRHEDHSTSRRGFLAHAAALSGAAAAISVTGLGVKKTYAEVAAYEPPKSDADPIRMAVIGTGGMGRGHCDAFVRFAEQKKENVQIVALADCWGANLNEAHKICSRQSGVEVAKFADYKELLKRKDIHGVLIASPEHWHAQHAIDSIDAGKDVYCEKPMTLDLPDALRLREVVNKNPNCMFQVGTQYMQLPKFQEAQKVVKNGEIGTPTFSQTSYCRNSKAGEWNYYHVDENWKPGVDVDWKAWCGPLGEMPWDPYMLNRWRRYRKTSTGIIGDLLVHVMTPMIMALDQGWPVHVVASGGHIIDKKMENHDQVNIQVEFESGHIMIIAGSTCNEKGLEPMIRGNKASIQLSSRHCEIVPESIWQDEIDPRRIECPDIGNDQDMHRLGWLSSIRTRKQPLAGVELGTKVMVIVDLATRAMWDKRAWKFDPKTLTASAVV
jgi:predicted dehydrogenase